MNAPHTVIVWNPQDQDDYEVVTIEWADRCVEKYQLNICQFPYDCRQEFMRKNRRKELLYSLFTIIFEACYLLELGLNVEAGSVSIHC